MPAETILNPCFFTLPHQLVNHHCKNVSPIQRYFCFHKRHQTAKTKLLMINLKSHKTNKTLEITP